MFKKNIIKILFIGANPVELNNTKVNDELETIKNAINRAPRRNFQLVELHNATNEAILNKIIEEKPTIVHFCGHGTQTSLLTHNKYNERLKDKLRIDSLLDIIKNNPIKCLILNCCFSQNIITTLFESIKGIEVAIGTNDILENKSAIQFAKSFYLSLARKLDYKNAYSNGKYAVLLSNSVEGKKYTLRYREPLNNFPFFEILKKQIKLKYLYVLTILLFSIVTLRFFKPNLEEFVCKQNHSECLANISLELIPNKKDLNYKQGDIITIHAKGDSPIYIRAFLYNPENDKLILLKDNQKINKKELLPILTTKADINKGRKLSLYVFYSKTAFNQLKKESYKNRYIEDQRLKHQILNKDDVFKSKYVCSKEIININVFLPVFFK